MERFRVDAPAYQLCCPRLPDHQPATCTGDSYELVFKANADGKATVSANGVVVDKNVDIKAGEPFSKSYAVTGDTTFKVKFTPGQKLRYQRVRKAEQLRFRCYREEGFAPYSGRERHHRRHPGRQRS